MQTVERLDELATDPAVNEYFKTTFGGVDSLRIRILSVRLHNLPLSLCGHRNGRLVAV